MTRLALCVTSSHQVTFLPDKLPGQVSFGDYSMLVLRGLPGTTLEAAEPLCRVAVAFAADGRALPQFVQPFNLCKSVDLRKKATPTVSALSVSPF